MKNASTLKMSNSTGTVDETKARCKKCLSTNQDACGGA